jgi:hypothetical protein
MITIIGIMLTINMSLGMFQLAVLETNPSSSNIFDMTNTPYANYVNSNNELIVSDELFPENEGDTGETGNIFTDTYNNFKTWIKDKLAPIGFLGSALNQPYGFLKDVGIPPIVAVMFGVLWYILALVIIVSWIGGR